MDHCFQLHPEMRPASYVTGRSPREQSLEAKVAELEQKLKSSASFAQISEPHVGGGTSGSDMYMFGAAGEVVAAASTRSQTLADAVASTSGGSNEVPHPRHAGPADQIGQARLPLSFGLVDTTVVGAKNPVPLRDGDSISKDVTQALAYKILHMPIFSGSELMAPDLKPAAVFHLAGRMLEGKADLPSLQVSQAVVDVHVAEEVEDLANLRAGLADAAIIAFGKQTDIPPASISAVDTSFSNYAAGAAYLADISARPARERHNLQPGVVRLMNDKSLFVVSRTDMPTIRATPLRVMMDSGAQPVMIGKGLADSLGLTPANLDPCPFTIVTSVGGTERATGYTKAPLRLIFNVGAWPTYTHLSMKCVVTNATNYDILVGQQALYPLGFGLDNWTEEAWIRPGWSTGDGRKVFIPVTFAATAMTMVAEAMFGCSGSVADLPCAPVLLEETMDYTCNAAEQQFLPSFQIPARHFKDPPPPWRTPKELSDHCRHIVADLELGEAPPTSSSFSFAQPIRWQPSPEGIVLVEIFGGIGTGLAAVLEAGITVRRYIHVDNGYAANRAVRHHIQQLLLRYPAQLSASAIHGCCGQLPQDVTMISDEDLRRLGHVDLIIAGWPCQGHSRAGTGQGLDDPRSSLFADLMRLTQWWFTHQFVDLKFLQADQRFT